jgi:hypothetical protein
MSFSDDMYEAMREFYFRGTPYPSVERSAKPRKEEGQPNKEGEEDDGMNSDKDDEEEESKGKDATIGSDSFGDGEDMVNCFPSRPSSAYVVTNESPSIWFKPLEVFEVSFADMSLSRQHTAAEGLIDDPDSRGIALRFPRFKRRRPDKKPNQATTCAQIAELFAKQSKQGSGVARAARGGI